MSDQSEFLKYNSKLFKDISLFDLVSINREINKEVEGILAKVKNQAPGMKDVFAIRLPLFQTDQLIKSGHQKIMAIGKILAELRGNANESEPAPELSDEAKILLECLDLHWFILVEIGPNEYWFALLEHDPHPARVLESLGACVSYAIQARVMGYNAIIESLNRPTKLKITPIPPVLWLKNKSLWPKSVPPLDFWPIWWPLQPWVD